MIEYGKQRSTIEPDELEITETKVFVASNVTPIDEPGTDEQPGFIGFEFDLTEYEKDEYISLIDGKNRSLEEQLTQTQIAMCEVYEMLG